MDQFHLQTGFWYEPDDYAYETTAIIVDSILYQIGGFKNQALPYINVYNIFIGEQSTEIVLSLSLERPALAYNKKDKTIYVYEDKKLLTYNILTKEIYGYAIDIGVMYGGMICKDDYLYIVGESHSTKI